jgi:hypothetical protein
MTREELHDAIRKLRAFTAAQGMQWVLDEVDDAISLGVPETRTLRQTNRQGFVTYEDITAEPDDYFLLEQPQGRRGRRSEEFIRSRPMTPQEQAHLLLDALSRVLTELDAIAAGALEALDPATLAVYLDPEEKTRISRIRVPRVESISFTPDEGSTTPGINFNFMRDSQSRVRVTELISQIQSEIDS